ncbi:TBC1D31 family protein [Megaselia abdita]
MKWPQSSFKLKPEENGKILSIHNTLEENGNIVRVRMVACAFDETSTILIAIDNRAVISVFNFACQKFHILDDFIPKPTFIASIPSRQGKKGEFYVGTKSGNVAHLDTQSAGLKFTKKITSSRVENISFPSSGCPLPVCLINSRQEAFIVDREELESKQRLELSDPSNFMKYISFVPNTQTIVIIFENDTLEIQQSDSCPRNKYPIRDRDKQLKNAGECLVGDLDGDPCGQIKDFSRGLINSMSFSSDGKYMCLTTLDQYILILATSSFDILKMVKVTDNTLKASCFLNSSLNIIGLTMRGDVILVDVNESQVKGIIHSSTGYKINTSLDGKMLYVIVETGEINVYQTGTIINYLKQMEENSQGMMAQGRQGQVQGRTIDPNIRNLITQKKLKDYLATSCDYGYPEEYRNVIWCVLLQLPVNKDTFIDLKSQQEHEVVRKFARRLQEVDIPCDEAEKLKGLVSNLANWSPIFADIDYIPGLVYPFLKVFPNSQLLTFEIVASILLNYGQLWFEFHPLEPYNFLGMCENVLTLMDAGLAGFYYQNGITPQLYAWTLIKTSFSEVYSDIFWFTLWDNIVSNPPYFLVFIIVAFSVVNRFAIMRLKCVEEITGFFQTMNPMHIKRVIKTAHDMDQDYPERAHPKRFFHKYMPIPKYYYPVFDSFPKAAGNQMEEFKYQIGELANQEKELNGNYDVMLDKLEEELRNTDTAKQTRDAEKWYRSAIKKDVIRINHQKAMLEAYKKELKNRRGRIRNFLREQHARQQCARGEGGEDFIQRLSLSDSESEMNKDHPTSSRQSKSESRLSERFNRAVSMRNIL